MDVFIKKHVFQAKSSLNQLDYFKR